MQNLNYPNGYDVQDEQVASEIAALHESGANPDRRVGESTVSLASDLASLAFQVAETVTGDSRILLVYLFGSYALGDTGSMSDLDLAVLLTRNTPFPPLRAELTHVLSALSGGKAVDLIILNQAPVELANSVISQGKLLYERSIAERVEYEADVMSRYGDYLPYLRAQRKDILEGAGNDRRVQRYREALGRTFRTLSAPGTSEGTAAR
jgi:uncharacterized protein